LTTRPCLRSLFAKSGGFTLIELMITIAVLAILLAFAVPSFQTLITNMTITSAANEITAALQQTRMEAIRRNRSVSFHLDTNRQWTIYVDINGDVAYTSEDDVTDTSNANYPNPIRQGSYEARVGAPGTAMNVVYTSLGTGTATSVCLAVSGHASSRLITIEASGRPMVETKGADCS